MNERTVQSAVNELSPPPAHTPGWEAFEAALTSALSVLDEEYLVVSAREGHRFVQFHVSPADGATVTGVLRLSTRRAAKAVTRP